jgi:hypothetical protein
VRFGIDRFGTDDKPALVTGIVVVSLLIGAGLGLPPAASSTPASGSPPSACSARSPPRRSR